MNEETQATIVTIREEESWDSARKVLATQDREVVRHKLTEDIGCVLKLAVEANTNGEQGFSLPVFWAIDQERVVYELLIDIYGEQE